MSPPGDERKNYLLKILSPSDTDFGYFCPMFTDTHAHLYAEEFNEDRSAMIRRALDAGVNRFMLPNIDQDSIAPMMHLCDEFPENCFPMMGLHPCSVNEDFEEVLKGMKSDFSKRKFYGVGEIGIDLYWDKTFIEQQKEAFKMQLNWALELELPVAIHARDSFSEIFEVMDSIARPELRGVFHCFTGTQEQAEKALSYPGFYLGIGGVVTFKNSGLDQVLNQVPLHRLVLETDAPYLAPVPHRGKRNESLYVTAVASRLSQIYGLPVNEIAQVTTDNAKKLFQIP